MKVICLSNKSWNRLPLTIGKIYDVLETVKIPFSPSRYDDTNGPFYKIKTDNDEEKYFEMDKFRELTTQEKREIKIKDILND